MSTDTAEIPHSITSGIAGVVAPDSRIELVREGFVFTEGPVGTPDGGLFFSDIKGADRTYRLHRNGTITVARENTGGANGLALHSDGDLLAAEGTGRRISRIRASGEVVVVVAGHVEKPFLAPNDLIADSKGGVYFTDPGPRPVVPGRKAYVYYLPPNARQPIVLDDEIVRPNGLTLTNDGKTLIVDDTEGEEVYAYDVRADGSVSNRRMFALIRDVAPGKTSFADGMAIDAENRIYVTTLTGVQVFDRTGRYLGTIRTPRQPANVAFSGSDKRTLFITAREGLYRLHMLAQGPARLGK